MRDVVLSPGFLRLPSDLIWSAESLPVSVFISRPIKALLLITMMSGSAFIVYLAWHGIAAPPVSNMGVLLLRQKKCFRRAR